MSKSNYVNNSQWIWGFYYLNVNLLVTLKYFKAFKKYWKDSEEVVCKQSNGLLRERSARILELNYISIVDKKAWLWGKSYIFKIAIKIFQSIFLFKMSSLHDLRLNHETTCLLSVVALFSTQVLICQPLHGRLYLKASWYYKCIDFCHSTIGASFW